MSDSPSPRVPLTESEREALARVWFAWWDLPDTVNDPMNGRPADKVADLVRCCLAAVPALATEREAEPLQQPWLVVNRAGDVVRSFVGECDARRNAEGRDADYRYDGPHRVVRVAPVVPAGPTAQQLREAFTRGYLEAHREEGSTIGALGPAFDRDLIERYPGPPDVVDAWQWLDPEVAARCDVYREKMASRSPAPVASPETMNERMGMVTGPAVCFSGREEAETPEQEPPAGPETGARHQLKTWPPFFQAVLDRQKSFEVRKDDRGFQLGDVLHLREWDPETETYTGRETERTVTYKASGSILGLLPGHVVLGLDAPPVSAEMFWLRSALSAATERATDAEAAMHTYREDAAVWRDKTKIREQVIEQLEAKFSASESRCAAALKLVEKAYHDGFEDARLHPMVTVIGALYDRSDSKRRLAALSSPSAPESHTEEAK